MLLSVARTCVYDLLPFGDRPFKGQTTSGRDAVGVTTVWRATAPGFALSVFDVRWGNGERDVRAGDVERGRPAIQHLGKGHRRLGVRPCSGDLWVELRMVRIKAGDTNEWTVAVDADAREWAEVLGPGWSEQLEQSFGIHIGTKAALLGTHDRTGSRLCARFPAERDWVLPHLFLLTRVVPLALGMTR